MSITKVIAIVTYLLSLFAVSQGQNAGLLRNRLFTDTNATRIMNSNKPSPPGNDLQSAFRELLSFNLQQGSGSSMSLSMSMSYSSPVFSHTLRPDIATPVRLPSSENSVSSDSSLRPGVPMEPLVAHSTTAKGNLDKANTKSKQRKASLNGLSGGAVAGIAVATVAAVTVIAAIAKKSNTPPPVT